MVEDCSDQYCHNKHMLELRPGGLKLFQQSTAVTYVRLVWVCLVTHRACCNLAAVRAFHALTVMIKHASTA